MQEKMQLAVAGVVVVALTLIFGLAMVLTSGPPDEGKEPQGLEVVPLPPFRSAFDYPDVGQEFGVIGQELGVIEGSVVEIPEDFEIPEE